MEIGRKMLSFCNNRQQLLLNIDFILFFYSFAKLAFSIDFPLMSGPELLVTGSLAHICYQIAFEPCLIFDS
jgi:hypothetical protein